MITSKDQLLDYKELRHYSNVFIETGSSNGDGIQRVIDAGFDQIYSIEAYYYYFSVCSERFVNNRQVHLYHGKSVDILPQLIPLFSQPCVFFLDAHPSSQYSYGYVELSHGDLEYSQDKIIRDELNLILTSEYRHIIAVDDMYGGSRVCAYHYREMILSAKPNYNFIFYDEDLGGNGQEHFYKDKILLAVPEEL